MKTIKLVNYIEPTCNLNANLKYGYGNVKGVTIDKEIIKTKAKETKGTDLKKYKIVNCNEFIYNPRTHGKRIGLGFNDKNESFIISFNNISFKVKDEKLHQLNPTYLFIWFNRMEWDRLACFNSWGSSTEVFTFDELCNMKMKLPDIEIQNEVVEIYYSIKDKINKYEKELKILKFVCDAHIEHLNRKYKNEIIETYIKRVDNRNENNLIKNVKSISTSKEFKKPSSKVNKDKLNNYKICKPNQIGFVQTTHNEKVFAYAYNDSSDDIVISSVDEVFETKSQKLLPKFLCLFFNRSEFDRFARFNSWGSAREVFTWQTLCEVKIPIPPIEVQQNIVDVYDSYKKIKYNLDKLKNMSNNLCSVLIRGSIS